MPRAAASLYFVSSLALLGPSFAFAQDETTEPVASTEEPPRVQEIDVVERGFFFQVELGANWIVNKPNDRGYGLGAVTGLHVGYDILPILSLTLGASAIVAHGKADNPEPAGDLLYLSPQLGLQFAFVSTERTFLYAKLSGGMTFGLPETVEGVPVGGTGPMGALAVGYEHFTKLRHFSFGLQVGGVVLTKPEVTFGLTVVPNVKYTF